MTNKFTCCILSLLVLIGLIQPINAQNNSSKSSKLTEEEATFANVSLSLLTCSPSDELYTSYGHSAIRMTDPSRGIDYVFNYGTFDFNTPYFYLKFLNGTLDYMLSVSDFDRFVYVYERENREVRERKFILSNKEKAKLCNLLIENYKPENRFYRYDFFFDNCATRIRDLVFEVKEGVTHDTEEQSAINQSYRDCLHEYVSANEWAGTGIDIILGIRTDAQTTQFTKAYLPDHLENLMLSANMVGEANTIVAQSPKKPKQESSFGTPNDVSWILLAIFIMVCIYEIVKSKWCKAFDVFFMVLLGVLSILLWYLWLISEIKTTSYNMNVLWASILYLPALWLWYMYGATNKWFLRIAWTNIAQAIILGIIVICGIQNIPIIGIVVGLGMTLRNALIIYRDKQKHKA